MSFLYIVTVGYLRVHVKTCQLYMYIVASTICICLITCFYLTCLSLSVFVMPVTASSLPVSICHACHCQSLPVSICHACHCQSLPVSISHACHCQSLPVSTCHACHCQSLPVSICHACHCQSLLVSTCHACHCQSFLTTIGPCQLSVVSFDHHHAVICQLYLSYQLMFCDF